MLNTDSLNVRALSAPMPVATMALVDDCEPEVKRLPGSVFNSSPLGKWALNASGGTIVVRCDKAPQGPLYDPAERIEVYLLLVGEQRIPMSSFQATMRRTGRSFVQAIVPNGSEHLGAIEYGALIQVQLGYYYPGVDEFDGLETIAQAPLEQVRVDEGPTRYTLTLSGYGDPIEVPALERELVGVQTRSITQGVRRVRCNIDLLLRPNNFAIDQDGTRFRVDQIQYFVNAASAAMEVMEAGQNG